METLDVDNIIYSYEQLRTTKGKLHLADVEVDYHNITGKLVWENDHYYFVFNDTSTGMNGGHPSNMYGFKLGWAINFQGDFNQLKSITILNSNNKTTINNIPEREENKMNDILSGSYSINDKLQYSKLTDELKLAWKHGLVNLDGSLTGSGTSSFNQWAIAKASKDEFLTETVKILETLE